MQSPRTFMLYVLLLAMELTSGFVLIVGLSLLDATSLGYSAFWVALPVGVTGTVAALTVIAMHLRPRWSAMALVGSALAAVASAVALTWSDPVSGLVDAVLFALAFWRGIVVTREPPGHEEVERRFGFGFALFFVGIVGVVGRGMVDNHWLWQLIAVSGIGYVAMALVALGAARIEHRREPGALQAVVLAIAAQIGLLVLLGIVALQIFSLDMFGWLGGVTQPVFNVVGAALYHVITPFASAIDALFNLIRQHAHHTGARVAPYMPQDNSHVKRPKPKPKQHIDPTPYAIGGLVFMLIVLATIGYLIWRSVPRHTRDRRPDRPYRERRESLLSATEMLHLLLTYLRALLQRGKASAAHSVMAVRRRVWGGPYPADPVRRAYAQLLRRSAEAGLERPEATTPLQFEQSLAARWSEGQGDFAALTEAYVARRYGDQMFDDSEMTNVRESWQRIRKIVRVPKGDAAGSVPEGRALPPSERPPGDTLRATNRSRRD